MTIGGTSQTLRFTQGDIVRSLRLMPIAGGELGPIRYCAVGPGPAHDTFDEETGEHRTQKHKNHPVEQVDDEQTRLYP